MDRREMRGQGGMWWASVADWNREEVVNLITNFSDVQVGKIGVYVVHGDEEVRASSFLTNEALATVFVRAHEVGELLNICDLRGNVCTDGT